MSKGNKQWLVLDVDLFAVRLITKNKRNDDILDIEGRTLKLISEDPVLWRESMEEFADNLTNLADNIKKYYRKYDVEEGKNYESR